MLPKNTAYPKHIGINASVKLRLLKKLRSTMGAFSVNSQISQAMSPTTATTPKMTMNGEENQSSSLPLSSMICNEPTQTTSNARPTLSIDSLRVGVSRLPRYVQQMNATNRPTGMLM